MIVIENVADLVQRIQGLKNNSLSLQNQINDKYYGAVRKAIGSKKDLSVQFKRLAEDIFDTQFVDKEYSGEETMNLIQSHFQTRLCTEDWYSPDLMSLLVMECECSDACGVELDTLVYHSQTFNMLVNTPQGKESRLFNFTVGLDVCIDKLDSKDPSKTIGRAFDMADAVLTLIEDINTWLDDYDSDKLAAIVGTPMVVKGAMVDVVRVVGLFDRYNHLKKTVIHSS